MKIAGIIKDSFQEYEGYQALVLFSKGCNLDCSYCYNKEQITRFESIGEAKDLIDKYLNPMHDAVVFLGGEPTIWKDLPYLCQYVKEEKKLKVKIFTNGMNYQMIKECIPYVDSVSIDYKCYFETSVLGVDITLDFYKKQIDNTIGVCQDNHIDFEIRTTKFIDMDAEELEELQKYVDKFNCPHIIQEDFRKYTKR